MKPKENRLIVADKSWAETLPEWILDEIEAERMVGSMINLIKPNTYTVGEAEIVAYLYTLNLRPPVSHEIAELYIYLTAKLMKKRNMPLLDFMEQKLKEGLTGDEEREFRELEYQIYKSRGGEIYSPIIEMLKDFKKSGGKKDETNIQ